MQSTENGDSNDAADALHCAFKWRILSTFRDPILPGRSETDGPIPDPHRSDPGGEDTAVGPVIVANQVARR
jgi:hypothetical protein